MSEQPPNGEQKKPKLSFPAPDWERIGKLGAVLLGLLYVVGILTVNTYLYRIGAAEFSLLRAQYIYTGALALAPIVLCFLSPIYAFFMLKTPIFDKMLEKEHGKSGFQSAFLRLIASKALRWLNCLMFALLPLITIVLFVDPTESLSNRIWTGVQMYWVSAVTGLIALAVFGVLSVKHEAGEKGRLNTPRPILAFGALVFFVIYATWYVSLFTTHIYTNIPAQFGGGKPTINRFLFFSDKVAAASDLGIEICPDSKLSGPISLLFETDKSYVVLVDGKQVTRLNKELIAAVQVVD